MDNSFYVVAKEAGAENASLPTWANDIENEIKLDEDIKHKIRRIDLENVPGAFQLLEVLSTQECDNLIKETENLGYLEDAAVSLPRSVRHNNNITWVVDDLTHDIIWNRCKDFMYDNLDTYLGKKPLSLNKRFRFYKYSQGDFFKLHTDGSWPGSRVVNHELITSFYTDRYSQMTFLIFLSENFEGGETQFLVKNNAKDELVNIRTPRGGVLCFPHGLHPLHYLHSSSTITSGIKYIIRSDVLFEI
ncbi:MAG: putative 2-oxoglutarate/Fe(II)-dependent dioxygenase YbiX [Clostridium sp.]|jgi:predicted 2-oxoglutarate/Fe(II)-dependent dioxygenase YbiX